MANNILSISPDGAIIKVGGILDVKGADEIVAAMSADNIYTLDFDEVTSINFAALRSFLRCRWGGIKFSVVHAAAEVAEKFEDSGVGAYINVCRKPKPLDMSKYEEFGASFMSKAFNSEDGDAMIKIYGGWVPESIVAQEKVVARAVMQFGIPTPLVGSLYKDGENTGLDFERIEGKRSFSRIISEEPEKLEEVTRKFAKMCKALHSTPCDTTIFSDRTVFYRRTVQNSTAITEDEKARVLAFLNSVPAETTCLHGDMQLSNVITNGKDDLWIDLSDFGYGNHMLDMGMWYFLCILNSPELTESLFHLNKAQMAQVWDVFVNEYFGADTPARKEDVRKQVEPFAALHMLYLGSNYGFRGNMLDFVKATLCSAK